MQNKVYEYAASVMAQKKDIAEIPVRFREKVSDLLEKPTAVIAYVQQLKIKELKTDRDSEEQSPVSFDGHLWDIDEKSLQRINGAIMALADGGSIAWTGADNEVINGVTAGELKGVITATAFRANALHEKYRVLRDQLNATQTLEEIFAVNWK